MTFGYRFEPEDWVRWCLYSTRRSNGARQRRVVSIIVSCAAYFAGAFFLVDEWHGPWTVAIALTFAIVLCILTPRYIDRRIERSFREQASSPQLKGSFGAYRLTVSAAGLLEDGPAVRSEVGWENVSEIAKEDDHVFILLSTGQAAVISRRSYDGPIAFDELPKAVSALRPTKEGQP
jgi:hypothetical protein